MVSIVSPVHNGTLYLSEKTDASAWTALTDISSKLESRASRISIPAELVASTSGDAVRFIQYFDSGAEIDQVYIQGLGVTSGLTVRVYRGDVSHPSIPSTLVATRTQDSDSAVTSSANEHIKFTAATNTCWMIEIEGFNVSNGQFPTNQLTTADWDDETDSAEEDVTLSSAMTSVQTWRFNVDYESIVAASNNYIILQVTGGVGDFSGTSFYDSRVTYFDTSGSGEQGSVSVDFDIPAGIDSIKFKAIYNDGSSGDGKIIGGEAFTLATRDLVSVGAILFGNESLVLADHYDGSNSNSDLQNVKFIQSDSSAFGVRESRLRSYQIQARLVSDAQINSIRSLLRSLYAGYCLVDMDTSSTNPYSKTLGYLDIRSSTPEAQNINSLSMNIVEAREWL